MGNELIIGSLGSAENKIKQELGVIMWRWTLCGECDTLPSCTLGSCPWSRAEGLASFWTLYEKITDAYCPERLGRRPALNTHTELIDTIRQIKNNHVVPRVELMRKIFENGQAEGDKPPTLTDQTRAFNIAASIALLMDFGVLHDAANSSEGNVPSYPWREAVSGDIFVTEAFPRSSEPSNMKDVLASVTATQLTKIGKLRLKATCDLRRHLMLDCEERIIWVFHQDSVLRESLTATESAPDQSVLPRTLLLEVLDTLHNVLFPSDPHSFKLLESLVAKHGFDQGLQTNGSTPYRKDGDPAVKYAYFGHRLAALHQELRTPTPHGWLQRRLQRKNETYMLMATLIGVCIAVMLGLLGLIVSIFQAWVSYQQWKHPVRDS
jgi:hypothetical protein